MSFVPYPKSSLEVDLREELDSLLHGSDAEIPKGQYYILRRMRHQNGDGPLIPCPCQSKVTRESDVDDFCPYCLSEGYLCDEEWIFGYKVRLRLKRSMDGIIQGKSGFIWPEPVYLFLPYNVNPCKEDRVLAPQIDDEGNIPEPFKISHYYQIQIVNPLRSDFGRIEFWQVGMREHAPIGRNK
jgi:hypothetical protein